MPLLRPKRDPDLEFKEAFIANFLSSVVANNYVQYKDMLERGVELNLPVEDAVYFADIALADMKRKVLK